MNNNINNFLEKTGKTSVHELTVDEIQTEIEKAENTRPIDYLYVSFLKELCADIFCANEIINMWLSDLFKKADVDNLEDVTEEHLISEIQETEKDIQHTEKSWGIAYDRSLIASRMYLDILKKKIVR